MNRASAISRRMNRTGVRGEFPDQKGEGCGENDRADNCDYNFQIIFHGSCLMATFDLIAPGGLIYGLSRFPSIRNTRQAGGKFQESEPARQIARRFA
jgi:hypothetical protein